MIQALENYSNWHINHVRDGTVPVDEKLFAVHKEKAMLLRHMWAELPEWRHENEKNRRRKQ